MASFAILNKFPTAVQIEIVANQLSGRPSSLRMAAGTIQSKFSQVHFRIFVAILALSALTYIMLFRMAQNAVTAMRLFTV